MSAQITRESHYCPSWWQILIVAVVATIAYLIEWAAASGDRPLSATWEGSCQQVRWAPYLSKKKEGVQLVVSCRGTEVEIDDSDFLLEYMNAGKKEVACFQADSDYYCLPKHFKRKK